MAQLDLKKIRKGKKQPKTPKKDPVEYVFLDPKDRKDKKKQKTALECFGNLELFFGQDKTVDNLLLQLPDVDISPVVASNGVTISGPNQSNDERLTSIGNIASGLCVSTYPWITVDEQRGVKTRAGDPNCDMFQCRVFGSTTIAVVTDGCGWGTRSRDASLHANSTFIDYVEKHLSHITDIKTAAVVLLK